MQDTHTTHIRTRSEMINRRLQRRSSEPELFRETEQQHDSGRMNRPGCSWILFDSELGHRLKYFPANLYLKLFQVRNSESVVVRSPIPPNQLGGIAPPR